ncbi:hypothetical protein H0H93_007764 [Arthromyces matolae]|nr:hypothetical protein H0H93_007764 [Arthromyces matolae]
MLCLPTPTLNELSVNGLTRRAPEVPAFQYDSPLDFMKSLQARQSIVRRQRIELWKQKGVKDLEDKVESLKPFGFPDWLVEECEVELGDETELISWFSEEEGQSSPLYVSIEEHAKDINRVWMKFLEYKRCSGFKVEEKESPNVPQHPENHIHGIPGNPLHSHCPKDDLPNIPSHGIPDVNELHAKARRARIAQWNEDQDNSLMERVVRLSTSGFPTWLVDDCQEEVTNVLASQFEKVETSRELVGKIQEHRKRIYNVSKVLREMCKVNFSDLLEKLGPLVREGGRWRMVIEGLAHQVEELHSHGFKMTWVGQIEAGIQTYEAMNEFKRLATDDPHEELKEFQVFVCGQWEKYKTIFPQDVSHVWKPDEIRWDDILGRVKININTNLRPKPNICWSGQKLLFSYSTKVQHTHLRLAFLSVKPFIDCSQSTLVSWIPHNSPSTIIPFLSGSNLIPPKNMKTFIFRGLAMSLIFTALLSCASPIGFNPHAPSLASANSLRTNTRNVDSHVEWAADGAQVSDSDGLTRRTIVVPVPIAVKVPPFEYSTPLKFIQSLEARRTIARHAEMQQWWPIRIKDLETKVDSLPDSGRPPWLESECLRQIGEENLRHWQFSNKEDDRDDSPLITKHKEDIERVRQKLSDYQRRPPGPQHGDSSTHNSSPTNDQVITSRDKARRSRIDQWNTGEQVKSLTLHMKTLPTSGFPRWLVDMYGSEIFHTLELIKLFENEERRYPPTEENIYLARLEKHRSDIGRVNVALRRMCKQNAVGHFEHLMPMIKADGGGWRKHIESLVHQINVLHAHNLMGELDLELKAAFNMGEEMWSLPPVSTSEEQKTALENFRGFVLGFQELEVGHGQG